MQTSGLIITAHHGVGLNMLLERLQTVPDLEIGETNQNKIAVVIEAPDQKESKYLVGMIENDPEVSHIDVVYVHFDEEQENSNHTVSVS